MSLKALVILNHFKVFQNISVVHILINTAFKCTWGDQHKKVYLASMKGENVWMESFTGKLEANLGGDWIVGR